MRISWWWKESESARRSITCLLNTCVHWSQETIAFQKYQCFSNQHSYSLYAFPWSQQSQRSRLVRLVLNHLIRCTWFVHRRSSTKLRSACSTQRITTGRAPGSSSVRNYRFSQPLLPLSSFRFRSFSVEENAYFWDARYLPSTGSNGCVHFETGNNRGNVTICEVSKQRRWMSAKISEWRIVAWVRVTREEKARMKIIFTNSRCSTGIDELVSVFKHKITFDSGERSSHIFFRNAHYCSDNVNMVVFIIFQMYVSVPLSSSGSVSRLNSAVNSSAATRRHPITSKRTEYDWFFLFMELFLELETSGSMANAHFIVLQNADRMLVSPAFRSVLHCNVSDDGGGRRKRRAKRWERWKIEQAKRAGVEGVTLHVLLW